MEDVTLCADAAAFRHACREVVRALIARYGWSLLSEEDLVDRVLRSQPTEGAPVALKQAIFEQYQRALYEACQSTTDLDRRTRAYGDLSRYLYRMAYNRWPDLAEQVMNRALERAHEKIGDCRKPGAFLAFAMSQAKAAFKEIVRAKQHEELSLNKLIEGGMDFSQPSSEAPRFEEDCLRALLDALSQLSERQRQMIVLKYFDGLSDDEISERTELSVSNIRVLRNRGINLLRKNQRLRDICGEI